MFFTMYGRCKFNPCSYLHKDVVVHDNAKIQVLEKELEEQKVKISELEGLALSNKTLIESLENKIREMSQNETRKPSAVQDIDDSGIDSFESSSFGCEVVDEDCGGCDKDNETLEELASYVDKVVKDGKKSPYICKDCVDYFSEEF